MCLQAREPIILSLLLSFYVGTQVHLTYLCSYNDDVLVQVDFIADYHHYQVNYTYVYIYDSTENMTFL